MPLYEFFCHQCEERFEILRPLCEDEIYCPRCDLKAERKYSPFSFQFHNPFPTRANIAGDGEGFTRKWVPKEEICQQ